MLCGYNCFHVVGFCHAIFFQDLSVPYPSDLARADRVGPGSLLNSRHGKQKSACLVLLHTSQSRFTVSPLGIVVSLQRRTRNFKTRQNYRNAYLLAYWYVCYIAVLMKQIHTF